jgi:hypothetical protein
VSPGGRGTRTGATLEIAVEAALSSNGYRIRRQQNIGNTPRGSRHFIDIVAARNDESRFLVSLKWQQQGGSAEEKVPFEVIKLLYALRHSDGAFDKAYIVLGGDGWSEGLVAFYQSADFRSFITDAHLIEILTLNEIIRRANTGAL